MNKWISVEDGLPDDKPINGVTYSMAISVIVFQPPFTPYPAYFRWNKSKEGYEQEFTAADHGTRLGGVGFDDQITHWMPLPEPRQ